MDKRVFGKTGIQVTPLGYGAMELRGKRVWNGRQMSDKDAQTILNSVLDAGINFIDTSVDYGMSEEYIGKFISKRRDEYYLATKCGCALVDKGDYDDVLHVWTADNLLDNIDTSLKRLKTDYVDFWQLHNPTPEDVEAGGLLSVMERVKASGKVRYIGISSTLPHIKTFIEWGVFDSFQIPYSAFEPEHEETITDAARAIAGTIIRGGLARGEPDSSDQPNSQLWKKWDEAGFDELRGSQESKTSFILRFTLSHPNINTIIVGTINPEHLAENLEALQKGPLSNDIYEEVQSRLL